MQLGAQAIQVDQLIFASFNDKKKFNNKRNFMNAIFVKKFPNATLLLQTLFDSVEENYEKLLHFPVSGIGLDFHSW